MYVFWLEKYTHVESIEIRIKISKFCELFFRAKRMQYLLQNHLPLQLTLQAFVMPKKFHILTHLWILKRKQQRLICIRAK